MTHCGRSPFLSMRMLTVFFPLFPLLLVAQRPSERYQSATTSGRLEPRVHTFVTACLRRPTLPKTVAFYSQGEWFVTPNLPDHIRQQGSNDDGTAQVWLLDSKPRAVSLWVHDDEFDRSTVACLNEKGIVTRQINEYMPGMSEPDLHYIYVHSFTLGPGGKYRGSGFYTDWHRQAIAAPKLTSEDRDFITGERQYEKWNDFDFAAALDRK